MNGVLVIDKPSGCTSHDVVARVRRALGESRIGHTGTLDPLATGVLPLVVGRATRLASMLSGADKQYEAGVRLGCATDTYDAAGRVTAAPGADPAADAAPRPPELSPEPRLASAMSIPAPAGIDTDQIEAALGSFRGTYRQTPPAFSAKKIGGVAAYKRARNNQDVEMTAVEVSVSELVLLGYANGLARVRVTATAGFYVRSLAHDLGAALGCGAHLESLRRVRAGAFGLADAVALDQVQSEGTAASARLLPLDRLLTHIQAVTLNDRGAGRASHGSALGPEDVADPATVAAARTGGRIRLLDGRGALLGLGEWTPTGLLHPVVVLV